MSDSVDRLRRFLSPDCGPFGQFVKYGVIGATATLLQVVVFTVLAATCLPCLGADDVAVRHLALPAVEVSDGVRAFRFAVATAIGFAISNVFCWLMNRTFVFHKGRYSAVKEFGLFIGVSGLAMALATGLGSLVIRLFGLMTSLAVVGEIVISFALNYFFRKYMIFKD